jgi:hypothetical protein
MVLQMRKMENRGTGQGSTLIYSGSGGRDCIQCIEPVPN